ncbi:ImmA/IrrE family metallo-endopeptidase [Burkholderia cepacia]|uniref:ImmA/IrrE family metallo-endopeptidase n=1 Tax=Burkholderia cepacia TaxID=292 RepID=UPI00158F12B4|nr:ImmA/IrrE family metallo-endopeptidase [Burkholderia cepacia]MDN7899497.1 ImmA/IrrE family metallo-endopeptidase [Burkholderia cepacia]
MASLNCGRDGDFWIAHALECIPDEIWNEHGDRFAFVSTTDSDGRRLGRAFAADKHIIVLAERVIPRGPVTEDHPGVRYLYFVVLHEVAHAVRDHRPPSEISPEANQAQEDEANALAFEWFNAYLATKMANGLALYTADELNEAQAHMREKMIAASQAPW